MWLINGSDLVWSSENKSPTDGCREWADAVCSFSDHVMVSTSTDWSGEEVTGSRQRKEAWKRSPTEEWCSAADGKWTQLCREGKGLSIHALWSRWKECFKESATKWVGRTRSRREKHWKGKWDEELHSLTSVKNWKRKLGVCHKEEKRAIKRRKRQLKRERKRARII